MIRSLKIKKMKTLPYKLLTAAMFFLSSATNAQKTVSKWNWDSIAWYQQNSKPCKIEFHTTSLALSKVGTESTDVPGTAGEATVEPSQGCRNYCPANNGSVVCELVAEDHCPMNGYWHTNRPQNLSPEDSALTDLSFSAMK